MTARAPLVALALLLAHPAAAQESPRPAQASLTLSAEGLHDQVRDGGGTARAAALSLRGALPVVDRVRREADGFSAWGLAVQGEARAVGLELPEVHGTGRFLRLGAGLAGSWIPSPRDVFWLQAGAFVAEQESLLGSAEVHPRLVAVGMHRASDTLRLLYGVGYTYDFGRGLPIPFLGAFWRLAPAWRLDVLLPVVVRATWTASDAVSLDFGTGVAGEQFRYRAASASGAPDPGPLELLHVVRLRLGAGCGIALSRGARLHLGAGLEGSRLDTGLATRNAAGVYVTAALRLGGRGPGAGAPFLER
jgi:hypothetical protein